jgi:hypothetical protein
MPKRQRPAVDSAELKSAAKRARYDPPLERNCFSVPQGEPPPGCKYYLRSFERKKPVNYYQSVLTNSNNSNTTSLAAAVDALKRNAHSYSINGLSGRCSTASTASTRKRKLETLRNDCSTMVMTRQRRQRQEQRLQQKAPPKQDVSLVDYIIIR